MYPFSRTEIPVYEYITEFFTALQRAQEGNISAVEEYYSTYGFFLQQFASETFLWAVSHPIQDMIDRYGVLKVSCMSRVVLHHKMD